MNIRHLQEAVARTEQIAQNAVATLYLSGRSQDLPDEELDSLIEYLRVEQTERDIKRGSFVIPKEPF